jgi:hypothetical protein
MPGIRCLSSFVTACLGIALSAQELIPNPGFEVITGCPTFASMLDLAAPWSNPTAGTPELYHACAGSGSYAGVPMNSSGGFQQPWSGDAFAGIYVYRQDIPDMREYITAPLLLPLEAGACYTFSMYVNAANDHELVSDGIGVRFTVGAISSGSGSVLPYEPHIENSPGTLITDTLGWTLVSGTYVAAGDEDHVLIGNFRNDAATAVAIHNPGVWYTGAAYLLIDEVSLVRSDIPTLDLGPDTLLCGGAALLLDATLPGATSTTWNDGWTGPVRTITTAGTYVATVHFGACSTSDTLEVAAVPEPWIDLGPDRGICPGSSLVLTVESRAGGTLTWDDGSTATDRTILQPGTYHARVEGPCGSATDSITVTMEECPEGIYLPNAFTPNGDAINEVFAPVFDARLWQVNYTISDRWGHVVFVSPDGRAWPGVDAPNGVYLVNAHAWPISRNLSGLELLGHVVVLR